MTEKDTFENSGGQGGAIYGHERIVCVNTVVMDRFRKEFFTGPGFTGDENRGVRDGCLGDKFHAGLHYRAAADDTATPERTGLPFSLFCFSVLKGTHQRQLDHASHQWFFNKVPGAVSYCKLGAIRVSESRDDDNLRGGRGSLDVRQQHQTIPVW
jgi:hypothetical protein